MEKSWRVRVREIKGKSFLPPKNMTMLSHVILFVHKGKVSPGSLKKVAALKM